MAIGVGRGQRVEVSAHQYGVRTGDDKADDAVGLGGTLHEVLVQGFRSILYGLRFAAGVVGSEFAFPLPAVLTDAGGLQVIVQQAEGVCTQNNVARHAAIGASWVGDETYFRKRVAAEYGNGENAANGVVRRNKGVGPVRKGAAQTVCREVGIVAELLEAKHIDMTLLHVTGYFLAGVSGDFVAEMMYVVGGYGEAAAGLAFPVRRRSSGRHIIIGGTEPDDCRQIFPVEEEGCQRNDSPLLACQRPAKGCYQAGHQ